MRQSTGLHHYVVMGPHGQSFIIIWLLLVSGIGNRFYVDATSTSWHAKRGIRQLDTAAHRRKLLSCFVAYKPMYQVDGVELPYCSKQYANTGTEWVPVEDNVMNEIFKATAADVVYAWIMDPQNPKTDSSLQCTGNITKARTRCWAGDRVRMGFVYENIDCCTTRQQCFVRTGGCMI